MFNLDMKKIKKVLLVDDDSAMNYVNEFFLKHYDYCQDVKVEQYPEDAINWIKTTYLENPSELPQLILLDYNMPVMNGFELANAISEELSPEALKKIRIFILSSTDISYAKDILANQNLVEGYLAKPLALEDLNKIFAT
jgi:CheY-like chemotaxis protein